MEMRFNLRFPELFGVRLPIGQCLIIDAGRCF